MKEQICDKCGYTMSFLLQVYCNPPNNDLPDHERLIYVFACLSPECIGTQNAIKVFRQIMPKENPFYKFADDKEYNQIKSLSEDMLIVKGIVDPSVLEKHNFEERES